MNDNKSQKASYFKTKKFKVGSTATLITVVVIAIVIVLNLIVGSLSKNYNLSLDLTPNKAFSLTKPTIDFLKSLNKDVNIILLGEESEFSKGNEYFMQANSVINQYAKTSEKIRIEYVDTVRNPSYLNDYRNDNLTQNSVIVRSGDKYRVITIQDLFDIQYSYYGSNITGSKAEQELTSAIVYVTSDDQIKIAVLNGYGEGESHEFIELLRKNNFDIIEVSILTEDIPESAALALIYGPERDYDEKTIEKVNKFLSLGNKALFYAVNPAQPEAPNIASLINKCGIKVNEGLVYETNTQRILSNPLEAVVDYVDEEYKSNLTNSNIPVLVPASRPIEVQGNDVRVLLQYSKDSGILPKDAGKDFNYRENISGPIPALVLSDLSVSEDLRSKVCVLGSYGALTGECLSANALNNSTYFINVINKLTDKEDNSIIIESKTLGGEELGINKAQANVIGILYSAVLPIFILILGTIVFIRRKNK